MTVDRRAEEMRKASNSFSDDSDEEDEEDEEEPTCRVTRRSRCWTCLAVSVLSFVVVRLLSRPLASIALNRAVIEITAIDVGVLGSSPELSPLVVARMPGFWWLNAVATVRDASISSQAIGLEGQVRIGRLLLPVLDLPFSEEECAIDRIVSVQVEDLESLARAAEHLMLAESTTWRVQGFVDAQVWHLGFFLESISGIRMDREIAVKGMAGFRQDVNPVRMSDLIGVVGTLGSLTLEVVVILRNPSFLAVVIDEEMIFGVESKVTGASNWRRQGVASACASCVPRVTTLCQVVRHRATSVQGLLAGYIGAEVQPLRIVGNIRSSLDHVVGTPWCRTCGSMCVFPAAPHTVLVQHIVARVSPTGLKAQVQLLNPLPQTLTLGAFDLQIFLKDAPDTMIFELNSINSATALPGTPLPPRLVTEVTLSLSVFGAKIGAITELENIVKAAEEGSIVVTARGPISVTLHENYEVVVPYEGKDLMARLGWCVFCT